MLLSQIQVFERFKKLTGGRNVIADSLCHCCPHTSKTDANTEKLIKFSEKNCHLTIWVGLTDVFENIDKETVWHILHENWYMNKMYSAIVSKLPGKHKVTELMIMFPTSNCIDCIGVSDGQIN